MAGPVIAVTDSVFPSLDPAKAALARLNPTFRMSKSANADDILAVAKDADAILVTYAKLTRDILLQLTKCKAIGRFGLGVDNIDLPTAKEKGIAVNYVPDYCIREVSDHAMALLLSLIRKVPLSNKLVQAGRWEMPAVVPIRRLEGTVLGLVGFGHIPRLVAPKAQAFGMKVIAYDPFVKPEQFKALNVEGVDFDTLLKNVRLHLRARAAVAGDARHVECRRLRQDEEGRLHREHRARAADRRAGAGRRARCRPGRRRRARRGDDRTAGQGFTPARPRQRHHHAAHRLLFDRSARGTADQVRGRRRARAQRRKSGLSDQRMMPEPVFAAPFVSSVMRIEPQWIDYNGHLNVAYYNVLFDRAVDEVYELIGLGPAYLDRHKHSTMVAEAHVRYLRELKLEDPVRVIVQLLDYDAKRIHLFEELRHADRKLAVGHLGKHDLECRHDGEEGGAVPGQRPAPARTHEGGARASAASGRRRPQRSNAGQALTACLSPQRGDSIPRRDAHVLDRGTGEQCQ